MDLVANQGMTEKRSRLAKIAALSALRTYGKKKAVRRVLDMGRAVRNMNEGNRAFYARIEALVREGIDSNTMDGERITWRR